MHIKCYFPPVNICHPASEILVPEDDVYKYSKELYEKGRESKSVLPASEVEAMEFFYWKSKVSKLGPVRRWIINQLVK